MHTSWSCPPGRPVASTAEEKSCVGARPRNSPRPPRMTVKRPPPPPKPPPPNPPPPPPRPPPPKPPRPPPGPPCPPCPPCAFGSGRPSVHVKPTRGLRRQSVGKR